MRSYFPGPHQQFRPRPPFTDSFYNQTNPNQQFRHYNPNQNFRHYYRHPRPRFQKGYNAYRMSQTRHHLPSGGSSRTTSNSPVEDVNNIKSEDKAPSEFIMNKPTSNEKSSESSWIQSTSQNTTPLESNNTKKSEISAESDTTARFTKSKTESLTNRTPDISVKSTSELEKKIVDDPILNPIEKSIEKKKKCKFKTHRPIPLPIPINSVKKELDEETKAISTLTDSKSVKSEHLIKQVTKASNSKTIRLNRNNVVVINDKNSCIAPKKETPTKSNTVIITDKIKVPIETITLDNTKASQISCVEDSPKRKIKLITPPKFDDSTVENKSADKSPVNLKSIVMAEKETPPSSTDVVQKVTPPVDVMDPSQATTEPSVSPESFLNMIYSDLSQNITLRVRSIHPLLTIPKLIKLMSLCGKIISWRNMPGDATATKLLVIRGSVAGGIARELLHGASISGRMMSVEPHTSKAATALQALPPEVLQSAITLQCLDAITEFLQSEGLQYVPPLSYSSPFTDNLDESYSSQAENSFMDVATAADSIPPSGGMLLEVEDKSNRSFEDLNQSSVHSDVTQSQISKPTTSPVEETVSKTTKDDILSKGKQKRGVKRKLKVALNPVKRNKVDSMELGKREDLENADELHLDQVDKDVCSKTDSNLISSSGTTTFRARNTLDFLTENPVVGISEPKKLAKVVNKSSKKAFESPKLKAVKASPTKKRKVRKSASIAQRKITNDISVLKTKKLLATEEAAPRLTRARTRGGSTSPDKTQTGQNKKKLKRTASHSPRGRPMKRLGAKPTASKTDKNEGDMVNLPIYEENLDADDFDELPSLDVDMHSLGVSSIISQLNHKKQHKSKEVESSAKSEATAIPKLKPEVPKQTLESEALLSNVTPNEMEDYVFDDPEDEFYLPSLAVKKPLKETIHEEVKPKETIHEEVKSKETIHEKVRAPVKRTTRKQKVNYKEPEEFDEIVTQTDVRDELKGSTNLPRPPKKIVTAVEKKVSPTNKRKRKTKNTVEDVKKVMVEDESISSETKVKDEKLKQMRSDLGIEKSEQQTGEKDEIQYDEDELKSIDEFIAEESKLLGNSIEGSDMKKALNDENEMLDYDNEVHSEENQIPNYEKMPNEESEVPNDKRMPNEESEVPNDKRMPNEENEVHNDDNEMPNDEEKILADASELTNDAPKLSSNVENIPNDSTKTNLIEKLPKIISKQPNSKTNQENKKGKMVKKILKMKIGNVSKSGKALASVGDVKEKSSDNNGTTPLAAKNIRRTTRQRKKKRERLIESADTPQKKKKREVLVTKKSAETDIQNSPVSSLMNEDKGMDSEFEGFDKNPSPIGAVALATLLSEQKKVCELKKNAPVKQPKRLIRTKKIRNKEGDQNTSPVADSDTTNKEESPCTMNVPKEHEANVSISCIDEPEEEVDVKPDIEMLNRQIEAAKNSKSIIETREKESVDIDRNESECRDQTSDLPTEEDNSAQVPLGERIFVKSEPTEAESSFPGFDFGDLNFDLLDQKPDIKNILNQYADKEPEMPTAEVVEKANSADDSSDSRAASRLSVLSETSRVETPKPLNPEYHVNLETFKKSRCHVRGCRPITCMNYHGLFDYVRPHSGYRGVRCREIFNKNQGRSIWKDPRSCSKKDTCTFCHNQLEFTFHPENYKKMPCVSLERKAPCFVKSLCAFRHNQEPISRDEIMKQQYLLSVSKDMHRVSNIETNSAAGQETGRSEADETQTTTETQADSVSDIGDSPESPTHETNFTDSVIIKSESTDTNTDISHLAHDYMMYRNNIVTSDECREITPAERRLGSNVKDARSSLTNNILSHLTILSDFSHNFGVLGNLLPIILQKASDEMKGGKDPINVFEDSDNVTLLSLLQQKVPKLKTSFPIETVDRIEFSLQILTEEIDKSKKLCKYLGLNIDAVARVTEGKSAEDISRYVHKILQYEGKSPPTTDQIQTIGIAVSARHYKMSLSSDNSRNQFIIKKKQNIPLLPVRPYDHNNDLRQVEELVSKSNVSERESPIPPLNPPSFSVNLSLPPPQMKRPSNYISNQPINKTLQGLNSDRYQPGFRIPHSHSSSVILNSDPVTGQLVNPPLQRNEQCPPSLNRPPNNQSQVNMTQSNITNAISPSVSTLSSIHGGFNPYLSKPPPPLSNSIPPPAITNSKPQPPITNQTSANTSPSLLSSRAAPIGHVSPQLNNPSVSVEKRPEVEIRPPLLGERPPLLGNKPPLLGNRPPLIGNRPPLLGSKPDSDIASRSTSRFDRTRTSRFDRAHTSAAPLLNIDSTNAPLQRNDGETTSNVAYDEQSSLFNSAEDIDLRTLNPTDKRFQNIKISDAFGLNIPESESTTLSNEKTGDYNRSNDFLSLGSHNNTSNPYDTQVDKNNEELVQNSEKPSTSLGRKSSLKPTYLSSSEGEFSSKSSMYENNSSNQSRDVDLRLQTPFSIPTSSNIQKHKMKTPLLSNPPASSAQTSYDDSSNNSYTMKSVFPMPPPPPVLSNARPTARNRKTSENMNYSYSSSEHPVQSKVSYFASPAQSPSLKKTDEISKFLPSPSSVYQSASSNNQETFHHSRGPQEIQSNEMTADDEANSRPRSSCEFENIRNCDSPSLPVPEFITVRSAEQALAIKQEIDSSSVGSTSENGLYIESSPGLIRPAPSPQRKEWKLPESNLLLPPPSPWQNLSSRNEEFVFSEGRLVRRDSLSGRETPSTPVHTHSFFHNQQRLINQPKDKAALVDSREEENLSSDVVLALDQHLSDPLEITYDDRRKAAISDQQNRTFDSSDEVPLSIDLEEEDPKQQEDAEQEEEEEASLNIDDMVELLKKFDELEAEEQNAFSTYLRELKEKDPVAIEKLYKRANLD